MSPGNLSQLENGKINYTQDSLEAVALALGCEPEDLFKDPEKVDELDQIAKTADGRIRQQIADLAKVLLKQQ
jgi:transcriptional regulator with XRE-family HTH domain